MKLWMIRGRTLWIEAWRLNGSLLGKTNFPVFPPNQVALIQERQPPQKKQPHSMISASGNRIGEMVTLQVSGAWWNANSTTFGSIFFEHNQHHRTITLLVTMCLDTPPSLYAWAQLLYGTAFTRQNQSLAKRWGEVAIYRPESGLMGKCKADPTWVHMEMGSHQAAKSLLPQRQTGTDDKGMTQFKN